MKTETLILRRNDFTHDMIKINFPWNKRSYIFDAIKKVYPKSCEYIDEDTIVGDGNHPYAPNVRLVNDDQAYIFFNLLAPNPNDGKEWVTGGCDSCGRVVRFLVTKDQADRYAEKFFGGGEPIQRIFPEIPNQWREMFRYPMPCTCPYCWNEMLGLKDKKPGVFSRLLR